MTRRRVVVAGIATTFVLSLVGCGNDESEGATMERTMTIREANQRVAEHVERVRAAFPREATYGNKFQQKDASCPKTGTDEPSGRVLANLEYQVFGLDATKVPEYFSSVRAWWESHGYRVLKDTPTNEYLWVESESDGFRMALQSNDSGELYVGANSPCVWPNGTPEPEE